MPLKETFTLWGGDLTLYQHPPNPSEEPLWLIATLPDALHATPRYIADIGCGTGVMALTAAKMFPTAQVMAIDIQSNLLQEVQKNAALNTCTIQTQEEDILNPSQTFQKYHGNVDLILSNPPFYGEDMPRIREIEHTITQEEACLWFQNLIEMASEEALISLVMHTDIANLLNPLRQEKGYQGHAIHLHTTPDKPPKRVIWHLTKKALDWRSISLSAYRRKNKEKFLTRLPYYEERLEK